MEQDEVEEVRNLEKELEEDRKQRIEENKQQATTETHEAVNPSKAVRAYSRWTRLVRGEVIKIKPKRTSVKLVVDTPLGQKQVHVEHKGWTEKSELARLLKHKELGTEVGELYGEQVLLAADTEAETDYSVHQPAGFDIISRTAYGAALIARHLGMARRMRDTEDTVGGRAYVLFLSVLMLSVVALFGFDALGSIGLALPIALMIGSRLVFMASKEAVRSATNWAEKDRLTES